MNLTDFLILVINLDRAPQRLQKITEQLNRLGLTWERVSAADGKTLSMEDETLLDAKAFGARHGKTPLLGELGCYLSHVWAFERFLRSDAQFAVVLEDDVLLHDELPEVLLGLASYADAWDMVKLSGVHSGTPVSVGALTKQHALAVMLSRCTGSSAYAVNRHAATVYSRGLLPMKIPYDHEFDRGWHWGLKIRMVTPHPCGHDDQEVSMINTTSTHRVKFHWSRRLKAYRWRLANELSRLAHGVGQWLRFRYFH
jgi:glycosyl transferase family 25